MARQRFRFDVPKGISPADRKRIGLDVITFIQEKAINEHTGFNAKTGRYKRFPNYTKAYAKKKGTSPSNVDLVLSANMFNAMDVVAERSGSITIGFSDPSQEGKAEGNQIGSYGKSPDPKKARPFLGISKTKLAEIISKVTS